MPSDQELLSAVEDWKKKGNDAFQKSDVETAVQAYSQGLVQVDRIVATPWILKATLLSNRAACYLKAAKLQECQEDCTQALSILDRENDTKLRGKILYRRAKSRFLQANMPHKKNPEDLQLAAKDCVTLLSFDPSNKEATQLLNTVRAQHVAETKHSHNTPMSRTLTALREKDDKGLHNAKVLLGLLSNDTMGASMELGRLGGVPFLLELANDAKLDTKTRYIALQCISCAGSHPPFCRSFLKDSIQETLSGMIVELCEKPELEVELIVGSLTILLRLILHLDRDDPNEDITGTTLLNYDAIVNALVAAFKSRHMTLIRAAIDVLASWTAGEDREAVIRASLDNFVDLPVPLTKQEMHQLSPQEMSKYKQRQYQKKTRDQAWAFERGMLFIHQGGMATMLECTITSDDASLRRELTVAMGKVFAALEADEKMHEAAKKFFGVKDKPADDDKPGVIIEEIDEDEEEGKVMDVTEEEPEEVVTFEDKMKKTALATALLLAKGEVGAWALGANVWFDCRSDLNSLAESNEKTALCLVAELLASAASVKETRPIVGGYLCEPAIKDLVKHQDKDVRTAAASSVAKLGLAEQETEDIEIIGLLEAACYMLEDGEIDSTQTALVDATVPNADKGTLSSIDRGVEVMTYLVSKTLVKEELVHGFRATQESKHTGLELLVRVCDRPAAGQSLSAYGLASTFQLLAATPLQLRKEAFEGKQVTMEQYDELRSMQKTEQEREFDEEPELKEDSPEQCSARIVKLAQANVPRALCQLIEGASDKTLGEVVLGLNRLADEPSVRGGMIQQGVLTKLIKVDKEEKNPSDLRKKIIRNLRHCMGKMLVTTNPALLTSAQRMGVIKPLIQLIRDVNSSELQQFEALMALTNIASVGDDTKNKIAGEGGLACFKFAMFSEHEMVKQAATEAMCNMVGNQKFMEMLYQPDELRLWLALASDYEEHYACARAAAGCLAMSTQDPEVARTLIGLPTFKQRMDETLESGSPEIMHRILVVILNLVELDGEFRDAAFEHGLVAFCHAYVESYHDGSKLAELNIGPEMMPTFNATVEVAKQVAKTAG
eukprot:Nitzschia sp. Nitz4//scaffold96_size78090//60958//64152//NITZ4_005503-RA/size78090-processed-gene-0.59-mRNA-1//-1//CDS//3329560600//5157//frame0